MQLKWKQLGTAIRVGCDREHAIQERCTLLAAMDVHLGREVRIDHERLEHAVGVLMAAHDALSDGPLVIQLVPIEEADAQCLYWLGGDPCLIPLTAGWTPDCVGLRLEATHVSAPLGVRIPVDNNSPEAPGEWARCVWELWSDART